MKRDILKWVVASVFLALINGCGGGSSSSPEPVITEPPAAPVTPIAPALKTFSLLKDNNPDLQEDIEFVRDGTTFAARLETALPVTSLTPTFSFDGTEVTLEEVAQTSGTTSQDFTQILTYRVSNEAGTTEDYQIDLTHFTGLPIIFLTTDEPVVSKDDYVTGTFRLDGGRNYDSVDQMDMKIRGRGNST